MKIAYIYNNKKIGTGADYINDLIVSELKKRNVTVKNFYPHFLLTDTPMHFKGINNILFFFSLLEKRDEILKCDIIQGTTYTPMAFMRFSKPVISHFGSTTIGFLKAVHKTNHIENECADILYALRKADIISKVNLKTRRPLNDIVTIEHYAAEKADFIIATSEIVKNNLVENGIEPNKIKIIYNAIEDYWFNKRNQTFSSNPAIVFLGRIGEDPFTLKLKGLDRLIYLYQNFPNVKKISIVMSRHKKLISWMKNNIKNHQVESNVIKKDILSKLANYAGSIMLITSRYEGFSLSLIKGMSQGLIPISFTVGVAPEIIRNGENGFLVNSIYEAKEKISILLKDAALRQKMSKNAKKTSQQFQTDIMINKMINLYKDICKKSKQSLINKFK